MGSGLIPRQLGAPARPVYDGGGNEPVDDVENHPMSAGASDAHLEQRHRDCDAQPAGTVGSQDVEVRGERRATRRVDAPEQAWLAVGERRRTARVEPAEHAHPPSRTGVRST